MKNELIGVLVLAGVRLPYSMNWLRIPKPLSITSTVRVACGNSASRELLAANAHEAADLAALISGYVDLAGPRNNWRIYIGTAELPVAK